MKIKEKQVIKIMLGITVFLIILGGSLLIMKQFTTNKVSQIKQDITALYLTEKKDFLKKNIQNYDLNRIDSSIEKVSGKEQKMQLNRDYRVALTKYNNQKKVNELFVSDPLNGDTVDSDAALKTDVLFKDVVNLEQHIIETSNKKDAHTRTLLKILEQADTQLQTVKKAKMAFNKLFDKAGNVRKDIKDEEFNNIEKLVDKIKNKDEKKRLLAKLEKIKDMKNGKKSKDKANKKDKDDIKPEKEDKSDKDAEKKKKEIEEAKEKNGLSKNNTTGGNGTTTPPVDQLKPPKGQGPKDPPKEPEDPKDPPKEPEDPKDPPKEPEDPEDPPKEPEDPKDPSDTEKLSEN